MKKKHFSKKQKKQKRTALQRIRELFLQAEKAEMQKLKDRYAELIHKLVLKYRIKLPGHFKRRYCKKCRAYWIPGKTVRIRIGKKTISYTCLKCGKIRRFVK